MKILAIRGCNLASLAGEFEIDLANGPLGVAGVFAIVGPTGAGKSTLLDAMCVALFDRTPRLPGHSRVTVGHGEEDPLALGAQDPRTLLRRGATHGWAEVDFESGDTRRYRARWSVRRARGATDGNLQDQQVSLTAIDVHSVMTERLGGTKTETLKAIHQRLGLTFDQFRRSALLAQGDFAAFLRAEGKDRSELLERMTGTEIYSKLSIAAHARAVLAEQALRERQAAALAIAVLDDETRSNRASDLALARVEREAARQRLADAEKLAVWRSEAALRAASLAQAETEHGLAEAEARGAEPLRSELVLRRRAEALRAVWDEAARLDRQHSIAQGDLTRAAAAAIAAESGNTETVATYARIADLHATIRAARMAAAIVELEVPKRLARGTIASPALPGGAAPPNGGAVWIASAALPGGAAPPNGGAVSIASPALPGGAAPPNGGAVSIVSPALPGGAAPPNGGAVWIASPALPGGAAPPNGGAVWIASPALPGGAAPPIRGSSVVGHAEERAHAALEPATWLVARRALAPEILAWPELDAKLGQERSLAEAIAAADRVLADQTTHHAALVAKEAAVQHARELAQHKLLEATREAEGFVKRRTLGLDAAGRAEDEARTRCGEVERLITISGGARTAANILIELDSRLRDLEAEAAADRERRAQTEKGRDQAALLRDERARVVAELRKAAGYQHARTELVAEEPCPLCGAVEHPWKHKGAFDALIADAERTLAEATTHWESATKLIAQLDARDSQRDAERARFASTLSTAQTSVEALAREWGAQLAALGELSLVTDPAHPAAERLASERTEAARTRLESARATRSAAAAAHKAVAEAQARVQVCQADLDHHLAELREIAATLATITAAVERIAAERASRIERNVELARDLEAIVARWQAALPAEDRASLGTPFIAATDDRASLGIVATIAVPVNAAKRARRAKPGAAIAGACSVSSAESSRGAFVAPGPRGHEAGPESSRGELATRGPGGATAIDTAESLRGDNASSLAESSRGEMAPRGPRRAATDAESSRGDSASRANAIDRARFADLVQAWRDRAAIVADAEASLVAALVEVDRAGLDAERAVADTAARHAECSKRSRELAAELVAATTVLDDARIAAGFDREALHRALADDPSRVDILAAELDRLGLAVDRARTRIAERTRLVADHEAARPIPQLDRAALPAAIGEYDSDIARARAERSAKAAGSASAEARARVELDADRVPELAAAVKAADQRAAELAATLAADDDARRRRDDAFAAFKAAERAAEVDRVLGQVIGSHDGKLFRSFAQSLTLDQLLGVANSHLEELAPRYQLERVPKHDLELQVIDRDFGGEVRSVQSLSGGESFLVSLALALGLSSMSAHDVRVRTLLIDEGFGTLDPATLDSALAVLDELQATGRQVGIISHVPALLDRVRAHVRVTPRGGGRSDVHTPPS